MYLIGLSGKKQVGKDTIADIIKMRRANVFNIGFADALYEEVANMLTQQRGAYFLWPKDKMIQHIKKHKSEFRALLQWWGTEFRRKQDDRYWILKWMEKFVKLPQQASMCVVTDVRFENEARVILNAGGYLWRISRALESLHGVDTHSSETELDSIKDIKWDALIDNNSTLANLEDQVAKHLASLTSTKHS